MVKAQPVAAFALKLLLLGGMSWLLIELPASEAPVLGAAPPRQSKVFLPLALNCSMKSWSGVHLGNRTDSDWNAAFLRRIDPQSCGVWPAAVVVFDYQIYNITRWPSSHPGSPCQFQNVQPITDSVGFDYVKRAAQAGTKVLIRIYPSPGNFYDWNDPVHQPNHRLFTGGPLGPEGYCRPDLYRSIYDIAEEMQFIHAVNLAEGFSEAGFLPANEPNIEWYKDIGDSTAYRYNRVAWQDMDAYFSALYNYVHAHYPGVKVLTPPMAQSARADGINLTDCQPLGLYNEEAVGYDYMPNTYGPKNDGVTWNNYWHYGREDYIDCIPGSTQDGMHASYHFPQWMKDAIRNGNKQVFITEADWMYPDNSGYGLPNKDGANASLAAESIRHFFYAERAYSIATYGVRPIIVSWLLTNTTADDTYNWHKAYLELGSEERPWFPLWYTGQETWP